MIRSTLAILVACLAVPETTAQHLHIAVPDAEFVAVARHVGVQPLGNALFVHSYETIEALKGEPAVRFAMLERKRVSDTPRPQISCHWTAAASSSGTANHPHVLRTAFVPNRRHYNIPLDVVQEIGAK